jgi:hypothetical protein
MLRAEPDTSDPALFGVPGDLGMDSPERILATGLAGGRNLDEVGEVRIASVDPKARFLVKMAMGADFATGDDGVASFAGTGGGGGGSLDGCRM